MNRFFILFLFCISFLLSAEEPSKTTIAKKSICLNMIVKNESTVIARCLASVKNQIDYWVIVDTGSTDGTQEIIKAVLKGLPGELHERPWVNFGVNRSQAIDLAKGKADYILLVDADEVIEGKIEREFLTSDAYLATIRTAKDPLITFQRAFLLSDHLSWRWKGVIHEQLECDEKHFYFETIPNIVVAADLEGGFRSQDPNKYLKDAKVLEQALLEEPDNSDYVYYLAQSYYNAKEYELSLENYLKRAEMAGWDEYTFWSKYHSAFLMQQLEKDSESIINAYSEAFRYRPTRAEPICRLAHYYYNRKQYFLCYALASLGMRIPIPQDRVYVEQWIYSYGLLALAANAALEMGWYQDAIYLYTQLSEKDGVPFTIKEQAKSSILQANLEIKEQALQQMTQRASTD